MPAAVAALDGWLVWVAISDASVLAANWLEALAVWAVVAAEPAEPDGRFCPVRDDVAPCAAPISDCSPDSTEVAEIVGIVTVQSPGSCAGRPACPERRPVDPAPRIHPCCKPRA